MHCVRNAAGAAKLDFGPFGRDDAAPRRHSRPNRRQPDRRTNTDMNKKWILAGLLIALVVVMYVSIIVRMS